MFTGIIEEVGIIRSLRRHGSTAAAVIQAEKIASSLKPGDSVAVNGVCLTVVERKERTFACDLSEETLKRSSFGKAVQGTPVNLERALVLGERLGGHIVQGHVDCTGRLLSAMPSGDGFEIGFSVPPDFERFLVAKGSVAVEGISLTVAKLKKGSFVAAVIPHTLRSTNLGSLKPGDPVNLEADILAKYFERFFQLGIRAERNPDARLSVQSLREQGY